MTKIWIDPFTGSWGAGAAVNYDVSDDELEALDGMSDSEICDFAVRLLKEGR